MSGENAASDAAVLRRLVPYVWQYRGRLLLSVLCAVLLSLFTGVQLILVKPTLERLFGMAAVSAGPANPSRMDRLLAPLNDGIDRWSAALAESPVAAIGVLAVLLLLSTVGKGIAAYGQEYLMSYCANRVVLDLRETLFDRLVRASMGFFQRERIGELLTLMGQDIELLRRLVLIGLGELVREPCTIAAIVASLFVLHPGMAATSFVILGCSGGTIAWFGKRIKAARKRAQEHLADQASVEQECFSNMRVVKAFGMEAYEGRKFSSANLRMFQRLMKIARARALVTPLMEVLAAIGGAGLLVVGGWFVLERRVMSGPDFLLFLFGLLMLYQPCKKIARAYHDLQQALVGGSRAFGLLDRAQPLPDSPDARPLPPFGDRIRFEGVCFSYDGRRDVLHDIELEVRRGEVTALVGPSGAGKSTLMDLLLRFYEPARGRITIDGCDLRSITQESLRAQIGVVPQDVLLFNDTVRANIAYGRDDLSEEAVHEAARRALADEFIASLPQGYDTVLAERGLSLSGGQRQRLAIARALAKDPAILIFDEATSSLDSESEHLLRRATRELFSGRTVFIIAHRFSTVMDADRIVVLDEGRIVDIGTHAVLLGRCDRYRRLYALQLQPSAAS